MDEEELASLAASIEAHGQRDPIILGRVNGAASEMLVDGRNRLRACEIAGVEPRFEVMQFEDDESIKAFVADKSEHRNLTKGQQAMRLAFLYPEAKHGGLRKKGSSSETKLENVSKARLSQARAVLGYSRELALAVRDGAAKLDEALATAKAQRANLESNEEKLARLRSEASDLAELVADERLSLPEAYQAFEQRKRDAAAAEDSKRETLLRLSEAAYRGTIAWANDEFATDVLDRLDDADFSQRLIDRLRIDHQALPDIQRGANALTEVLNHIAKKGS
jgi:hypothetical protein